MSTLYLWLDHKSAERCYSVIKNDNTLGWRARIACVCMSVYICIGKYEIHIQQQARSASHSKNVEKEREREREDNYTPPRIAITKTAQLFSTHRIVYMCVNTFVLLSHVCCILCENCAWSLGASCC